jgi:hypothetical protein
LLALIVVAGVVLNWLDLSRTTRAPAAPQVATPSTPAAPQVAALSTPAAERSNALFSSREILGDREPKEKPPSEDPLETTEYPKGSWDSVDLEAIRAALPDNLYWEMSSPTKDPEVLSKRQAERERWNLEYGKVLSNTATAEEIDAYYAHRQRLSEDYLEFVVYLLTNYGYEIPARDVALLKLAAEMHNARLEELPRQIAEAHQRREAHDAARRAWLEEQRAFEGEPADSR